MNIETLAKRYEKLPSDWRVVPLGEVLTNIVGGGTPSRNDLSYWGGDIPWLSVKDMRTRRPLAAQEHITARAVEQSATSIIPADTVITATRVGLGKVVRVPFPAAINQDLKALIVGPDLDKSFLEYWIVSIASFLESIGSGTTVKGIRLETLRLLPFPLAPLNVQREIVAEIEKQFSRLDEAVANLKRVKANLKRYKAAVEGRLVPTEAELAREYSRSYETGSELMQRMRESRRIHWKSKYIEQNAPVVHECPALPEGWAWTTIGHLLSESIINGLSIKGSDTPPGVAALKLNAMTDSGFDYAQIRYLPIEVGKVKDILIREGDFFISRGNGSLHLVGRGTIAQPAKGEVIFPDTMMRLRFLPEMAGPNWPQTIWESRLIRQQIEQRLKTTAGIFKIAQPQVASILVPLPPHAEQSRIVAEVHRRLSIAREIEVVVETSLIRASRLRNATLSNAFAGAGLP